MLPAKIYRQHRTWAELPLFASLILTVKPVLSDHIQQDIFLFCFFQTGGCLLLQESSAEAHA